MKKTYQLNSSSNFPYRSVVILYSCKQKSCRIIAIVYTGLPANSSWFLTAYTPCLTSSTLTNSTPFHFLCLLYQDISWCSPTAPSHKTAPFRYRDNSADLQVPYKTPNDTKWPTHIMSVHRAQKVSLCKWLHDRENNKKVEMTILQGYKIIRLE